MDVPLRSRTMRARHPRSHRGRVGRSSLVALCELILSAPIYSARGFGRCTFISRTLLYQIDNHVMMMMTSVQRPAAASSFVAKSTKSVRRVSRVVRAASVAAVRI